MSGFIVTMVAFVGYGVCKVLKKD